MSTYAQSLRRYYEETKVFYIREGGIGGREDHIREYTPEKALRQFLSQHRAEELKGHSLTIKVRAETDERTLFAATTWRKEEWGNHPDWHETYEVRKI